MAQKELIKKKSYTSLIKSNSCTQYTISSESLYNRLIFQGPPNMRHILYEVSKCTFAWYANWKYYCK